jgi:hypothetical protein
MSAEPVTMRSASPMSMAVNAASAGRAHARAAGWKAVTGLLETFGHTDVIDLGDISTARGAEMVLPLWLRLMGALNTPFFNFKIVR